MITRTPELAEKLTAIMEANGLNMRQLAQEAQVRSSLVSRMLHPEYPGGVSKQFASVVIETLARGDLCQMLKLFSLAGIDIYTKSKDSKTLFKML